MNNSNPTRTNISDLRRRLLTAPGNRTVPVPVEIEAVTEPILPPSLARRLAESTRSSPTVIAPVAEAPAVTDLLRQVGRRTPLPGVALQANHFLHSSGDPSGVPAVPAAVQNKNPQEEIAQLRQTLNDVQPILEEAQAQEQAHLESDQQLRKMIEERDQIMVRSDDSSWLARVWRDRGQTCVLREPSRKSQRLRRSILMDNERTMK